MRMLGERDGAVDQPVDGFHSPLRYAGLVYGKGALFFENARALLGDAAFFDGLRRYVARYGFRIATPPALREELGRGSPHSAELQKLAHHWLDQSYGDQDLGKGDLGSLLAGAMGGAGGQGSGADEDPFAGFADLIGPALGASAAGGLDLKKLLKGLKGMDGQNVQQLLQLLQGGGMGGLNMPSGP
jgi:hypothetical protein